MVGRETPNVSPTYCLHPSDRCGRKEVEMAALRWTEMTQLCPFGAQYTREEEQNYGKCSKLFSARRKAKQIPMPLLVLKSWCLGNLLETRLHRPLFSCLCWVEPSLVHAAAWCTAFFFFLPSIHLFGHFDVPKHSSALKSHNLLLSHQAAPPLS